MRELLLFLTIVIVPAAWGAPCQVSNGDDPVNASRVRIVRFADGRGITIVGHNHGDRELPFELNELIKTEGLSNSEFSARLDGLAGRVETASLQAAGDVEYFRKYLERANGKPFVGFESTDEIVHSNLQSYQQLRDGFIAALAKRGLPLRGSAASVLRVALGPAFYLLMDRPGLRKNFEIRGFETAAAISSYNQASEKAEKSRARLKSIAASDKKFLGKISETDFQLTMLYDSFDPIKDPQRLLTSFRLADLPAAFRPATLDWLRSRLDEMITLKAREAAVADGMIAAGRSGILFMGAGHLEGLAAAVASRCAL